MGIFLARLFSLIPLLYWLASVISFRNDYSPPLVCYLNTTTAPFIVSSNFLRLRLCVAMTLSTSATTWSATSTSTTMCRLQSKHSCHHSNHGTPTMTVGGNRWKRRDDTRRGRRHTTLVDGPSINDAVDDGEAKKAMAVQGFKSIKIVCFSPAATEGEC